MLFHEKKGIENMTIENKNDNQIICTISNKELRVNGLEKGDIIEGINNPASKGRDFIDAIMAEVVKNMEMKDTVGKLSVYEEGSNIVLSFIKDINNGTDDVWEDDVCWTITSDTISDLCMVASAVAAEPAIKKSVLLKNSNKWGLMMHTHFEKHDLKDRFHSIVIENTTQPFYIFDENSDEMFDFLSDYRTLIKDGAIEKIKDM